MPQLDIIELERRACSPQAPCSSAAPCYQVVMKLNNLSFAPTTTQDPDLDLVWLTQWFVPSTTDPNGGKNFFVYAESFNGAPLQCFSGENAEQASRRWGDPDVSRRDPTACRELPVDARPQRHDHD